MEKEIHISKVGDKAIVQLYTQSYGKSIHHLNSLFTEAKKDFPNLDDKDVELVVFGGDSKKYIHGIRFLIPQSWIAKDIKGNYFEWSNSSHLDITIN